MIICLVIIVIKFLFQSFTDRLFCESIEAFPLYRAEPIEELTSTAFNNMRDIFLYYSLNMVFI
jgi:hypothetical protein